MRLTEEQRERVAQHLGRITPQVHCPVCSRAQWEVADRVFELREFVGGGLRVGGDQSIYPVVLVVCGGCGYTAMLGAIALGLLTSADSPGPSARNP